MAEDLFGSGGQSEHDAYVRRVQAFTAPVAANRGAIINDSDALAVALGIYAAFGDSGAESLSRGQIATATRALCDEDTFNARFEVFVGLGMLLPIFNKDHQQRYIFNIATGAGLLVWERLAESGGVDELISLLDRTQHSLQARSATRAEVLANLKSSRRWLTVAANHLFQMVSSSPLSELITVRRHHSQDGLIDKVQALSVIVSEVFPDLDPEGFRVLRAAMRYIQAREAFVERLLDEGGNTRDFSLLDHEEYLDAALTRPMAALADAFATIVLDPPAPWIDATRITDAVLTQHPPTVTKKRPPRPTVIEAPSDPLARRAKTEADRRTSRDRRIELLLQGRSTLDVSATLRSDGWPRAAVRVADLLAAHQDPASPYRVVLSNEFLVDPPGPVTYLSPVTVVRDLNPAVLDAGLDALLGDPDNGADTDPMTSDAGPAGTDAHDD